MFYYYYDDFFSCLLLLREINGFGCDEDTTPRFSGCGINECQFGQFGDIEDGCNASQWNKCSYSNCNIRNQPCGPAFSATETPYDVRPLSRKERVNILEELIEDRERDIYQAGLIRRMQIHRRANRNTPAICQAILEGADISKREITEMLLEDVAMDCVFDKLTSKLTRNVSGHRNADHITGNISAGFPNVPTKDRVQNSARNARIDKVLGKIVDTLSSPYVANEIVQMGVVDDLIEPN